MHILIEHYFISLSPFVLISPFLPHNKIHGQYFTLHFLWLQALIYCSETFHLAFLSDISCCVTPGDGYQLPPASIHVIEGEPNMCSPFLSVPPFPCSFRRSSITLRRKWRSTVITRSNWSSPTRSCSTWKLWETRSTSGKPKKNTTRFPRRPERLDIR